MVRWIDRLGVADPMGARIDWSIERPLGEAINGCVVVSGTGTATVNGHSYPLRNGTLMLIERGNTHAIACTGRSPLRTLNFFVPPAFDPEGEALPTGKPK